MSATPLVDLRADAARRNLALDAAESFTVKQLATRWQIGETTVRDIPRDALPYMEFGSGLKHRRRRYPRAGVLAYEAALLGAPAFHEGAA